MKQKKRTGRRLLSFLLTLAMVLGLLPGMSMTVYAGSEVSYQEGSWSNNSVAYATKTAANLTTLTTDTTAWGDGNWYVVPANGVTISDRISVTGTVNLILTDGNTLTASKGITVADGNTLNIYAQSEGDTAGSLLINSVDNYHAGIGGVYENKNAGTVNIHGGKITTKGGGNGAGIGGFWAGNGGNITIYGGTVDAEGGKYAAGIGGGQPDGTGGNGGTVTIYGGTVTAKGSTDGGAGIGGGATGGNGGTVIINGGTVIATGGPANNYGCGSMGIGGVCGKKKKQENLDPDHPESNYTITPPENGSLTVNNGLKVYGGNSADPTTEITEQLSNIYADSYNETTVYQYMIVSAPPHTHSLANYELTKVNADNDTITATCGTSDCPLDNSKATMTIIPKSDGTATITGDYAAFGVTDSNIITGESGGFKTASITVNGLTASISYGVNCITYADNLENGTISGDTAATVGATITPTITPATGYELKTLTVTPAQGSGVESVTVTGGTFVMPQANVTVSAEFQKIPYTISFAAMSNGAVTASKNGQPVSETNPANYGDTITLTATPDSGFALSSLSVKDSRNTMMELSGNGDTRTFTMPASNVTVSATFEGAPYNLTISNEITGGTVTASSDGLTDNGTKAKAGSEVTLTVTPDTGFNFESLTVTRTADSSAVSVTKVSDTIYKFTMPQDAVSVSATFVGQSVTASLNVTGNEGTTCTAAILDENYNEINSVTKKAGEKFILLVNRDNEYDFNVKNGENDIIVTEFTKEEYEAYLEYADKNKYTDKNSISVSANTVLAWVTMPGAEGDSVALTVNFSKPKTFTILYQPAAETNPDIVACKIVRNVNNAEEVSYTFLQRGATMSDGTAVWSMKMTAAFPPTKIAFVPSSTPTTDEQKTDLTNTITNAVLNDAIVSQNTSSWNDLSGAKYLIIGGNAKVVTAAFITDTSAMTTYKDNAVDEPKTAGGATTYRLAVCGTDEQGNVTSFGTVKAPAAPTTAPEGKEFAGWRGFEYGTVSSKATEKIYSARATINVRENATFTAVWKPATLKVNLDLGGGTGNSSVDPVTYGAKLPKLEDPTRSGFAFDGWTVSEAVTENGVAFAKGSTFDLDTPITANLNLTAQWKHVHSYTCYQISDFGDRLAKYQKYETALHIAVCGCNDIQLMAHEFDSNGKCACGYQKPGAQDVTLNISYGQWSNGTYTEKMQGMQETAKQGQEVSISAPPTWGNLEFSKWQYSAGDGQWVDLTAYNYASFIIPANMQVRALYINPVTVPQVDLSARKCDDQTEVNGQTYTMDNILFHLNYKLPDGYTFEDAGIRLGDNNGISYYFIQQVRYSYDNETKGILSGITVGLVALDYLTGNLTSYDVGTGMFAEEYSVNYLETEDNVLDKELDAATLAKYMYESKPVNVEKYDPIYWEAKAVTKGMSGSMETIPPLRFAQKYGGRNYIYGIGYLRYKDKDGKIHTIYTEALPTAVKDMPKYTVTATPDGKTNTKQN